MPIKDCVKEDDILYCWNNETGKIDVYTRKSIPAEKCPTAVIGRLMKLLADKKQE